MNSTYIEDDHPKGYWQKQYEKLQDEYEHLPKIHGWIARDEDESLWFYGSPPKRGNSFWIGIINSCCRIHESAFSELNWESEPIEVELLIKKL